MQNESKSQVANSFDALGLLSRLVYQKFGREAIPIIEDVCYKLGLSSGKRMRGNSPPLSLKEAGAAFAEGAKRSGGSAELAELSENKVRIKGYKCGLGLENTGRELCQAMMAIDKGTFEAATEREIKLDIPKSLAAGDEYCDTIYTLKE